MSKRYGRLIRCPSSTRPCLTYPLTSERKKRRAADVRVAEYDVKQSYIRRQATGLQTVRISYFKQSNPRLRTSKICSFGNSTRTRGVVLKSDFRISARKE